MKNKSEPTDKMKHPPFCAMPPYPERYYVSMSLGTYRVEELLVHEERLTTSGVGTGEQWYLFVVLPAR